MSGVHEIEPVTAFPHVLGTVAEAPWRPQVAEADIEPARDLGERWRRRLGEA
jgi:hypothetical protein